MKPQEAIEQFNERLLITDFKEQIPEYYEAMETAIEALEKQIPKKPSQDSIGLYYFPTCPNCHKWLEYDHHCECGQALDWSEEE